MQDRDLDRSRRRGTTGIFAVAAAISGAVLGEHYIQRLPNHDGYFLVAVKDEVKTPRASRPRRTAFILIDGLREDAAETMESARVLARAGQCRLSDQGPYTVSRPEYALLSTGLEVDRSGSRNNDLTTPLAAESVWEIAREGGLRVAGSSHLPWFQQLFPRGFDRFTESKTHETDVFGAAGELVDINLFHPLYVDDAGHRYGAASPEYAAAVARADREIASLLARLDLTRDLVVLTADHGHRAEGGHGGAQPEIRNVLACFAGLGVSKSESTSERRAFDGRSTGPLLALLLGLRFPRHMRAGDDGLDVMWEIAERRPEDAGYFAERRAAVLSFREENRSALERWLGDAPGTWDRLYAREARRQTLRGLGIAAIAALLVAARLRRRDSHLRALGWLAANGLALWLAHRAVLGELDYTVINRRELFIVRAFAVTGIAAAVGLALHRLAFGRRQIALLVDDWTTLVGIMVAAAIGHVFAFGWPLGFPVPSAAFRYFPFFGSIALVGDALLLAVLVLVELRSRARERSTRSPD